VDDYVFGIVMDVDDDLGGDMIKLTDLTLEERETHISMSRDKPGEWDVYTDDPIMIRKFERIGLVAYHEGKGGGKFFTLPDNQITIRKKRVVSVEEQERKRAQIRKNFGKTAPAPQSSSLLGEEVDEES